MDKNLRDHVVFDFDRAARTGVPEAVFCESKPREVLERLLSSFSESSASPVLFTRLDADVFHACDPAVCAAYDYDDVSRTAFAKRLSEKHSGRVAVVAAGAADAFVTFEAARTLQFMNIPHTVFEDCGVAGLWRLQKNLEAINQHQLIIVIAGMEAALGSVLAGLSTRPIIAVPTSVGYGVCRKGETALHALLSSCSPGLTVVNIDNGFGAACAAAKTLNSFGF